MSNLDSQFKSLCLNRDLVVKQPHQGFVLFLQGKREKPSVRLSSPVVLFHHPASGVFEVFNILDTPHEGPLLRIHYCLVHPWQLAFKDCAPFLTTAFLWYCAKEYQAGFVIDQLDSRLLVSSCFKTSVGGLGGKNNNSPPSPTFFFFCESIFVLTLLCVCACVFKSYLNQTWRFPEFIYYLLQFCPFWNKRKIQNLLHRKFLRFLLWSALFIPVLGIGHPVLLLYTDFCGVHL